ncbi:unnamed protein product, partial [Mycena citricolor]
WPPESPECYWLDWRSQQQRDQRPETCSWGDLTLTSSAVASIGHLLDSDSVRTSRKRRRKSICDGSSRLRNSLFCQKSKRCVRKSFPCSVSGWSHSPRHRRRVVSQWPNTNHGRSNFPPSSLRRYAWMSGTTSAER